MNGGCIAAGGKRFVGSAQARDVVSYKGVDSTAERPVGEINALTKQVRQLTALVFGLLVVILLLSIRIFVVPAVGGIEACRQMVDDLRYGRDRSPGSGSSSAEVAELEEAICSMAADLKEGRSNLERAIHAERLLAESRWLNLRPQLNPHFLFNALNSIDALIGSDTPLAREMLLRLANFCRATLGESGRGVHSIEQEVGVLEQYLWIERVRWQDSLQVDMDVDTALNRVSIPAFTLHPLVENAIKYGQLSGSDPLIVNVRVSKSDGNILVEVVNNGRWFKTAEGRDGSSGVGLRNLKERYNHICNSDFSFETSEKNGFVYVRISYNIKSSLYVSAEDGTI